MRTGTITKAERRQIGIEIVWDGETTVSPYRHDECVNPVDDMIDMLDGFGVAAGMRVQMLPERRFRLLDEPRAVGRR